MSINVNRSNPDPFYRYKMPPIEIKVEGSGNGIKTVIPNMPEVAKALHRPPSYPTKFLGIELGAQSIIKPDKFIINGEFDDKTFQDLLDKFIRQYVLCDGCQSPETKLEVTTKKTIEQRCAACGHFRILPHQSRLMQYIVNNPPNEVKGAKGRGMNKAERRAAKIAKQQGKDTGEAVAQATNSGSKGKSKVQDAGADIDVTIQVDAPDAAEEDLEWSVDTSEEAVRAREAAVGGAVASMVVTADSEKSAGERLDIFADFLEEKISSGTFRAKEVLMRAEQLECKEKGTLALAQYLLDEDNVVGAIDKHCSLLAHFTDEDKKAQKCMLGGIEKLVEKNPARLAKIPAIFKKLYDEDVVEEPAFTSWAEKVSKKYVPRDLSQKIHDKAAPFITWLKEAESESEESEADGVDIAFDASADAIATDGPSAAGEGEESGAESELDIDDI